MTQELVTEVREGLARLADPERAETDAAWVQRFVATHDLSPLSRREALEHVGAG